MRRLLARYCSVLLAVSAISCVRSATEMLSPARYAPTVPDSVTVFISVADVDAQGLAYERVAMLFIKADALFTNERTIMRRAREDAAKVGANGVILGEAREPGQGFFDSDRRARAMAVRTRPKLHP